MAEYKHTGDLNGVDLTDKTDKEANVIERVVGAPYICTIPAGGLRAIKCYPDAITCFIRGIKIGYSKREKTMIVPLGTSVSKREECKTILEEHLRERTQQIKR